MKITLKWWISILYKREYNGEVFFVFDVGVITDVISNRVFVDYPMEGGIISIPLQSKDFNCSIKKIPSRQYMWQMLLSMQHSFERISKKRKRVHK
jgi:hypothetical protein